MLLTPAQTKTKIGAEEKHVYVRAWTLFCVSSLISTQTFRRVEGSDHVSGQLRGDKECFFSDLASSGIVWRKVPESDAQSVGWRFTMIMMIPGDSTV